MGLESNALTRHRGVSFVVSIAKRVQTGFVKSPDVATTIKPTHGLGLIVDVGMKTLLRGWGRKEAVGLPIEQVVGLLSEEPLA